jgi:hypothetical protein
VENGIDGGSGLTTEKRSNGGINGELGKLEWLACEVTGGATGFCKHHGVMYPLSPRHLL